MKKLHGPARFFLVGLALVAFAGIVFPAGGLHLRDTDFVLPLLVGTTLFISGFLLDASRLLRRATHLPAILFVLSTTYVVAPALAYVLARLWSPASEEESRFLRGRGRSHRLSA